MNRLALPPGVVIVSPPPAENGAVGADAIPLLVKNRGRGKPRVGRAQKGYVVYWIDNSEIKELLDIFRSRLEYLKEKDQKAELGVKVVQKELVEDLVHVKKKEIHPHLRWRKISRLRPLHWSRRLHIQLQVAGRLKAWQWRSQG